MTDAAALIRGAKLRTDEYRVCVDPDLVGEYETLLARQAAAREKARGSLAGGEVLDLQGQIDALLAQMQESTITLKLQALPRSRYRALRDAHPPRKAADGTILHKRDEVFAGDYDGFYSELARVSIVEPKLDAETLSVLLDERLTEGQWDELTTKVFHLNKDTVSVPFSPGGSATQPTS